MNNTQRDSADRGTQREGYNLQTRQHLLIVLKPTTRSFHTLSRDFLKCDTHLFKFKYAV